MSKEKSFPKHVSRSTATEMFKDRDLFFWNFYLENFEESFGKLLEDFLKIIGIFLELFWNFFRIVLEIF